MNTCISVKVFRSVYFVKQIAVKSFFVWNAMTVITTFFGILLPSQTTKNNLKNLLTDCLHIRGSTDTT